MTVFLKYIFLLTYFVKNLTSLDLQYIGVRFQTWRKWLSGLFNVSNQTGQPGSPRVSQSLLAAYPALSPKLLQPQPRGCAGHPYIILPCWLPGPFPLLSFGPFCCCTWFPTPITITWHSSDQPGPFWTLRRPCLWLNALPHIYNKPSPPLRSSHVFSFCFLFSLNWVLRLLHLHSGELD